MNVIVIIRIACLVLVAIHASYTDFRFGVVKNRSIAMGCIVAIVLIVIDAFANEGKDVLIELINISIAFILGVSLYMLHIWGAGDAKLLLLLALLLPPQLYFPYDKVIACSIIIPIAFACSFLYLFVDSIVHLLVGKEGIEREVSIRNMKKVLFRWCICVLSIMLANQLLLIAWPSAVAFPWLRVLINLCVVFICTSIHGIDDINRDAFSDVNEDFEYSGIPQKKKASVLSKGRPTPPRSRRVAKNALAHAGYRCEIDGDHFTFTRKNSDKPYTEPHHLIPLSMQDEFEYSLDVEENVVSLCSNCHNWIHLGQGAEELIRHLYDDRIEHLRKVKLDISIDDLLKMYGI